MHLTYFFSHFILDKLQQLNFLQRTRGKHFRALMSLP